MRTAFVKAMLIAAALFAVADVRFSHEYVTPMAESLLKQSLGPNARVTEPESVFAFRDHLTFLNKVMSPKHREMGLLEKAEGLATTQEDFTTKQGIKLYGENPEGGSEAICHNAVVEDLAAQEGVRSGDERNYARVEERLQPYKDNVETHEKNIEALKRELSNLYR